jgi:hypothetical protein
MRRPVAANIRVWVFNNTQASLLFEILAHASIDTFSIILGVIFPPEDVASALPFSSDLGSLLWH